MNAPCIFFPTMLLSFFYLTYAKNGGVCIFLSTRFKGTAIDLSHYCIEFHFEIAAVRIRQCNLTIATIYRSPNGDLKIFHQQSELVLRFLSKLSSKLVITEDFKVDFRSSTNDTFSKPV